MKIWSTVLLVGAIFLGGCGGGGGGGGDGSSGSLAVSFSSTSVNFVGVVGGASGLQASQPQIDVTLKNGSGTYYATARSNSPYVTARFATQSDTNGVIFLSMIGNPPPGHHGGLVTFEVCGDSSCGNILSTSEITFTYDLYGFQNTQLLLNAAPGGSVVTGVASIVPAPPPGTFSITSDSAWLSASLSGGSLTVRANPISLAQNSYFGNLKLKSGMGEIDLAVSLAVGNATSASAQNITVASDSTDDLLTRSLIIDFPSAELNSGGGYSAVSNANWLIIPGGSFDSKGVPLTFFVDPTYLYQIPNFTSTTATITVSSYGYPDIVIPVTVNVDLAEIYQIDSRPLLAGATGQTIDVRGKGFAALSTDATFQTISFGFLGAYTNVVSDTEAIINIPFAPVAGPYQILITNPVVNQAVSSAYFAATPATSLPGTAVPISAGTNSQVLYDPVRGSVLNLDLQNGQLSEYTYSQGTWSTTQCAMAGAVGMTLSPDQSTVYVGTTSDKIYNYGSNMSHSCPTVVTIDASGQSGALPARFFAETYDNRLWPARSSSANFYYDLDSSSFGSALLGGSGGVTIPSPDGGLIIGSGSSGSAPVYSAATHAVSTVSNAPAFSNGSYSPSSALLLTDYSTVYSVGQSSMSVTGFVAPEPGFTNYGAVISYDGSRIYALEGDPTSAVIDHISVYDSTLNSGVAFNLLGQVALPTKASDCTGIPVCNAAGQLAADPNGRNLYWVGNRYMIVIPLTSGFYPAENKFRVAHVPKH